MYDYIRGIVIENSACCTTLETHGVGYRICTPVSLMGKLPLGKECQLYTSWVVRETAQTLFGFAEKEEREVFEQLISLSGIGPKTALALIGHLPLPAMSKALVDQDSSAFAKVPGIGKKTAQRLLLDLQGKISIADVSSTPLVQRDAVQALLNLGYTLPSAEKAIHLAAATLPENCELSTLITAALTANGK